MTSRPLEHPVTQEKSYATEEGRWTAVTGRDERADGAFVYAVKTTGVYCRPSCAARRARRENVAFYETPAHAERAGFRACLRCRPSGPVADRKPEYAAAISAACRSIAETDRPVSLGELAGAAGMSRSHFHRVFKSLTGLTPGAYVRAHRARRLREQLAQRPTVTSAIHRAGFGSTARFYAAAPKLLGMTPTAFKAGGAGMTIRFALGRCTLGSILVAASEVGICAIELDDDPEALLRDFQERFSRATLIGGDDAFERWVAAVVGLVERPEVGLDLPLDVRGTAFQQRVWRKLRDIPCGETRTYSQIARELGEPDAARAVAAACAANRLAVAIPCHRVVRIDGSLSGYRWGVARKAKLLEREGQRPRGRGGAAGTQRLATPARAPQRA